LSVGLGALRRPSHLGDSAIDEQFRTADVAAVIRREEHHRLDDLVRGADSAQGNEAREHFQSLLLRAIRGEQLCEPRGIDELCKSEIAGHVLPGRLSS